MNKRPGHITISSAFSVWPLSVLCSTTLTSHDGWLQRIVDGSDDTVQDTGGQSIKDAVNVFLVCEVQS